MLTIFRDVLCLWKKFNRKTCKNTYPSRWSWSVKPTALGMKPGRGLGGGGLPIVNIGGIFALAKNPPCQVSWSPTRMEATEHFNFPGQDVRTAARWFSVTRTTWRLPVFGLWVMCFSNWATPTIKSNPCDLLRQRKIQNHLLRNSSGSKSEMWGSS